jgi:ParB/RepB/Spo0J family partition protein
MSSKQPTSEPTSIPFKQIFIPEDANYRSDLPKIKEIAASFQERGQLTPLIVTNGGTKDKPYTLVAGYRRAAAWEMNGWESRDIMVVVRQYKKGDAVGRLADNWTENEERETTSPFDQAELLHRLVTGTYPVAEDETAEPVDKDTICTRFNISKAELTKKLRMFHNIDADVARLAKKAEAPLRLLYGLSNIEGSGKTKDEQEEDRAKRQLDTLNSYIEQQAALAEAGRKRNVRSDAGKGKKSARGGDEDHVAPIKPTKRIDDKGRSTADYLIVLNAKVENAAKEERLRLEGMIDACRFYAGELKRFPGLTAEDFKILDVEEEEEEEDKK